MLFFLLVYSSSTLRALSYRSFEDEEVVVEFEAVIEGKVVEIESPKGAGASDKPAMSIAWVGVNAVYKGKLAPGDTIGLLYWSHLGKEKPRWTSPETYRAGETLMFALKRQTADQTKRREKHYLLPPRAAKPLWHNMTRQIYDRQLQSAHFRRVAGMWRQAERHLRDPKLAGIAAYFLARQKRLSEDQLLLALETKDPHGLRRACDAARLLASRVGIPKLLAVYTRQREHGGEVFSKHHYTLVRAAGEALLAMPITKQDIPLLLRLAKGAGHELRQQVMAKILKAGALRRVVTSQIASEVRTKPHWGLLETLKVLDARAGYEAIRSTLDKADAQTARERGALVKGYHTAWAKRFVLERGPIERGHAEREGVRAVFRFTNLDVDPFTRLKIKHGDGAFRAGEFWRIHYRELRKAAEVELAVFEKEGPDFSRLSLESYNVWEAYAARAGSVFALTDETRDRLRALVMTSITSRPEGLDAEAKAVWLIDLYGSGPSCQIWVAANGTFGLGWLPDRAWGRSGEMVQVLEQASRGPGGQESRAR